MRIGEIILNDNEVTVITEITNGQVTKTELLHDYVSKITVIEYQGEYKTIREILETQCEKYLQKNSIVF